MADTTTTERTITYADTLAVFRDLLDDGVDFPGYSEYVRGGVNLIAELFGREDVPTGDRMEEVLNDLRRIDQHMDIRIVRSRLRDASGSLNPNWNENSVRFQIAVHSVDKDDELDWRYKLELIDNKFLDSDSLPISAIAGGESWDDAYQRAGEMMARAQQSLTCIF